MTDRSAIEWTDSTFNPWYGCTKVGPGCDHCYAETLMDTRYRKVKWGAGQPRVRTSAANWKKPLAWNRKPFWECSSCHLRGEDMRGEPMETRRPVLCPRCGENKLRLARRRVFCASLADVFDNEAPETWRADLFELIVKTPNLDWLLLTKRVGNVRPMMERVASMLFWLMPALPDNVWLGATVVNQEEADRDIPKLLATPARVRFLSCEPMLGPIDFLKVPGFNRVGLDLSGWWVIGGGESGHHARPMHPEWAQALRDQCESAGVPFFMKQMGGSKDKRGALTDLPDDLRIRAFPTP